MSTVGWTSLSRLFRAVGGRAGRWGRRRPSRRRSAPGLESLEPISLLSAVAARLVASPPPLADARAHRLDAPAAGVPRPHAHIHRPAVESSPQTEPTQTATLSVTLSKFANLPMSPPLDLFDSTLGTLTSVTLTQSATQTTQLTVQNLDAAAPVVIPSSFSGSYQINGLSQPIVQPTQTVAATPMTAGPFGSPTDTVTFPPLVLNHSTSMTLTDPASLAFYTASAGRTTVTPTVTATASASTGTSSNISSFTRSTTSATVTVTYTYVPSCPSLGTIGRIGVHHQRTLLVVPFNGPVNPTLAGNPADYFVISRTGHRIRIVSATYNPATNAVTLRPARRLNVHYRFGLSATLPCPDGMTDMVERVSFGSKYSLIGFHDHRGDFVPVRDGRIVRSALRPRLEGRPGPRR